MKTAYRIARGLLVTSILNTLCVAAYAEDVSRKSQPAFHAELKLLNPADIAAPVGGQEVLTVKNMPQVAAELPGLRVSTKGPQFLVINQVAKYHITLQNLGTTASVATQVRFPLPKGMELQRHSASVGKLTSNSGVWIWNVPTVNAGDSHDLELELLPQQRGEFELDLSLSAQPANNRQRIVVQQPDLSLELSGPKVISYSDPANWSLKATNVGTSTVENLQLELFAGDQSLDRRPVPPIAAGESQAISIPMEARRAGEHVLRVVGRADGTTDTAEAKFRIVQGELDVKIEAVSTAIAGQACKFQVVLFNVGDVDVQNASVTIKLPEGVAYLSGIANPQFPSDGITWTLEHLPKGEKRTYEVELSAAEGGSHLIEVLAQMSDVRITKSHTLNAITAPDLRLIVRDPIGPQLSDRPMDYVIELLNHGTDIAKGITVLAIVDERSEILDVSGTASIKEEHVHFQPISELAAATKRVFKVRTTANQAGIHQFRVLVESQSPETRLAVQETTLVIEGTPKADKPSFLGLSDAMQKVLAAPPVGSLQNTLNLERDLLDLSLPSILRQPTLAPPPIPTPSPLR